MEEAAPEEPSHMEDQTPPAVMVEKPTESIGSVGGSTDELFSSASSKEAESTADEPEEERPVTPIEEQIGEKEKEMEEDGTDIMDDLEPCGINISNGQTNDDSVLGTSLHDELMYALSFDAASPGNALVSTGAWAVPKVDSLQF